MANDLYFMYPVVVIVPHNLLFLLIHAISAFSNHVRQQCFHTTTPSAQIMSAVRYINTESTAGHIFLCIGPRNDTSIDIWCQVCPTNAGKLTMSLFSLYNPREVS